MARFADGEAWPVQRTGDKTAGSAPAQSSINNSAAVETQGEKSGPQKAVVGSGEGTPWPVEHNRGWDVSPTRITQHGEDTSRRGLRRQRDGGCAFPECAPTPHPRL